MRHPAHTPSDTRVLQSEVGIFITHAVRVMGVVMIEALTDADRTADELNADDIIAVQYESVYTSSLSDLKTAELTVTDTSYTTAVYAEDDDGTTYQLVLDGGEAVELKKEDRHGNQSRIGYPDAVAVIGVDSDAPFTVQKIDRDGELVKEIPADSREGAETLADAIHFGSRYRAEIVENNDGEFDPGNLPQIHATTALKESEQREAAFLSVFEGWTYEEIGEWLGVSRNTIGKVVREYKTFTGDEARYLEHWLIETFGDRDFGTPGPDSEFDPLDDGVDGETGVPLVDSAIDAAEANGRDDEADEIREHAAERLREYEVDTDGGVPVEDAVNDAVADVKEFGDVKGADEEHVTDPGERNECAMCAGETKRVATACYFKHRGDLTILEPWKCLDCELGGSILRRRSDGEIVRLSHLHTGTGFEYPRRS